MYARIVSMLMMAGMMMTGCQPQQKKDWSIAIAANNSKYENCAVLLQDLFMKEGLTLDIQRVSSGVEAARLVAEGKADFTLVLSHSDFLIPKLGEWVKDLRTVMPLFENAMFVFHRSDQQPESIIDLTEHSKIFLEVPDSLSEQYLGLQRVFGMLNTTNYEFVADTAQATLMPVWGTFSGTVVKKMLGKKWKLYSMEESFIEYALIVEPRFGRLTIPVRYGDRTNGISTLLSNAYLISGEGIDRTDLYDVISMLYDNRVYFMSKDKSYMAIREDFKTNNLNFPLHAAATNYLKRNEPTFLERHADYYGLLISIFILLFGIGQYVRNYIARKKKDRIDLYFQEYLTIKGDPLLGIDQRINRLEALHAKAIHQMILEKLDISDFSVFSKAIESERLLLRGVTLKKNDKDLP